MSSDDSTSKEEYIEFSCEHCGQSLTVEEEYEGQQVECPACHKAVFVPELISEEAPSGEELTVSCPKCHKNWPEGTVLCVDCGTYLKTGTEVDTSARWIKKRVRSLRARLKSIPRVLTISAVILACYLSYRYSLGPLAMEPCCFVIENGTTKQYQVDIGSQPHKDISPGAKTNLEVRIGMPTELRIRAQEVRDEEKVLVDDFTLTCRPGSKYLYNIEGKNTYYIRKIDYQEDGTIECASFASQVNVVVKALSDRSAREQLIDVLDQIESFCQSTIEGKIQDKLIDLADYDYHISVVSARKKTEGKEPVLKLSKEPIDIPIKEGRVKYYPDTRGRLICAFQCPKTSIRLGADTDVMFPDRTVINLTRDGDKIVLSAAVSKQKLNAFEHKIQGRWTAAITNDKWMGKAGWSEIWRFAGEYRDEEGKDWKVSATYPVWCEVSAKRRLVPK